MKTRLALLLLIPFVAGCSAPAREHFWATHTVTGTLTLEHGEDRASGSLTITPSGKESVPAK